MMVDGSVAGAWASVDLHPEVIAVGRPPGLPARGSRIRRFVDRHMIGAALLSIDQAAVVVCQDSLIGVVRQRS
jgi:hypothetical protein